MLRNFLIFILVILWIILGWKACNDWSSCCGADGNIAATSEAAAGTLGTAAPEEDEESSAEVREREVGPVMFNWSDNNPLLNDEWDGLRNQLLSQVGEDKILEITGFYSTNEANNSDAENLGLSRAEAIRKLLGGMIPNDRISLIGRIRDADPGDQENPFIASSFKSLDPEIEEKIIEIGDRIDIYFPLNSNQRIQDREIEEYLGKLAERLKQTSEKVRITGHTDNTGDTATNLRLGQSRADVIKNYLLGRGVPVSQIITISRGETQPVASNETENGRAKNRRAEVQIIN